MVKSLPYWLGFILAWLYFSLALFWLGFIFVAKGRIRIYCALKHVLTYACSFMGVSLHLG
jgi:hypothetical protein